MYTPKSDGRPKYHLPLLPGILLLAACGSDIERPYPAESWTKLDANGQRLAREVELMHYCVHDQLTGLTWEVARPDSGLHSPGQTYTWYSSDSNRAMGVSGHRDGGDCVNSRCDTEGRVEAVNAAGLCGYHDWRVPSRAELMSLGDRRLMEATGTIVDMAFFPYTGSDEYWSAETFRLHPQGAWVVSMRHGLDRVDQKSEAKLLKLVRGNFVRTGE